MAMRVLFAAQKIVAARATTLFAAPLIHTIESRMLETRDVIPELKYNTTVLMNLTHDNYSVGDK